MTAAAKPVACRARDLVLMAGGATLAAAVATWALVRGCGEVLVGATALRSRVTRRSRMRSRLVVAAVCTLGTGVCPRGAVGCSFMDRVVLLLSMLLVVLPAGACTLGTCCVLGLWEAVATSARRSGCACT